MMKSVEAAKNAETVDTVVVGLVVMKAVAVIAAMVLLWAVGKAVGPSVVGLAREILAMKRQGGGRRGKAEGDDTLCMNAFV